MSDTIQRDNEKDIELKKGIMKYLWNLGYITRRNVILVDQWQGSHYTDIDVLGIRIDQELNSNLVVCDCKSTLKAPPAQRLFWLAG